jgi:hypothetical protein
MTETVIKIARWPALLIVITLALAILYRYGPSREKPQWRWITWGSAVAAVSWLVISILFSWYAENFGNYNKTYGFLGAIIAFSEDGTDGRIVSSVRCRSRRISETPLNSEAVAVPCLPRSTVSAIPAAAQR